MAPNSNDKWDKIFKNGPSKICGRQPLKIWLSSTNFNWSILEYLVPNETLSHIKGQHKVKDSGFSLCTLHQTALLLNTTIKHDTNPTDQQLNMT